MRACNGHRSGGAARGSRGSGEPQSTGDLVSPECDRLPRQSLQITHCTSTIKLGIKKVCCDTDVGGGRLNLSLAHNYNKSEVTKFDLAAFATYHGIDIAGLAPNHRATLSVNWSLGVCAAEGGNRR